MSRKHSNSRKHETSPENCSCIRVNENQLFFTGSLMFGMRIYFPFKWFHGRMMRGSRVINGWTGVGWQMRGKKSNEIKQN